MNQITATPHQRANHHHGWRRRDLRQPAHSNLPRDACRAPSADQPTEFEEEAMRLWHNLPARDVVFYPVADFDLTPLERVSHLADVFVLCDWRWSDTPTGFDATIAELLKDDYINDRPAAFSHAADGRSFAVPAKEVEAVTGISQDFGLFHEPAWVAGHQPWCRITRLKRRTGQPERPLWLVYIVGNCVETYQRLFVDRDAAPKLLWLDAPLGVDLDRWPQFVSPTGQFGSVFSRANRQPKYVAALRHELGWRQTMVCQQVRGWHHACDLTLFELTIAPMGDDGLGLIDI